MCPEYKGVFISRMLRKCPLFNNKIIIYYIYIQSQDFSLSPSCQKTDPKQVFTKGMFKRMLISRIREGEWEREGERERN